MLQSKLICSFEKIYGIKLVDLFGIYWLGRTYISFYPCFTKNEANPLITAHLEQIVELASLSLFFIKSKTISWVNITFEL